MHHKRFLILWTCLLTAALLLTACDSGSDGGDSATEGPPPPTPTPAPAESIQTSDLTATNVGMTAGEYVLAWIAPGTEPGRGSGDAPGQLVLVGAEGSAQVAMNVPQGTGRVVACSERATSPDTRYFTFFVGNAAGTLYLMDGTNTPQAVTEVSAMACEGLGTFRYTPDSRRFGVIDFDADAASSNFAGGWLEIYESASREQVTRFENAVAFDTTDTQLAFISRFFNAQNLVTEVAISLWPHEGNAQEITTLFAEPGCQFTSGQVTFTSEETLAAMMGQRCNGSGTTWTLHTIDLTTRSATQALTGTAPGSFFSYARTNALFAAPGGGAVYYTFPDGLTANTANVRRMDLGDIQAGETLISNVVMPRFNANRAYDFTRSALPVFAPDDMWAAVASSEPNGDAAVNVFDLSRPGLPALTVPAGNRSDVVSQLAFTPGSDRLLFVVGGTEGADNSLFALDLNSGVESRVIRGHFAGLVVAPDGDSAALAEWTRPSDPNQPQYLTLLVVGLDGGQSAELLSAAEVVEGDVRNQHFVLPLAWRTAPVE